MSEVIKTQNGQHAPSSLEAWEQFGIREIQLTEQLSVRVRPMDVIAWLSRDEDNPLLATIVQSTQDGTKAAEAGANLMSDGERMAQLSAKLDALMVEVMVSPPLLEQGSENGIPVARITFGQKMAIFFALIDEEQLGKLENFRSGQSRIVQSGPKGKTIQSKAK